MIIDCKIIRQHNCAFFACVEQAQRMAEFVQCHREETRPLVCTEMIGFRANFQWQINLPEGLFTQKNSRTPQKKSEKSKDFFFENLKSVNFIWE